MIFAVVKANPPHLVSHLLFTQRFRRERAAGGEEGYCLINLMAVAEFLENVDLAALGLGDSEKMVIRRVLFLALGTRTVPATALEVIMCAPRYTITHLSYYCLVSASPWCI